MRISISAVLSSRTACLFEKDGSLRRRGRRLRASSTRRPCREPSGSTMVNWPSSCATRGPGIDGPVVRATGAAGRPRLCPRAHGRRELISAAFQNSLKNTAGPRRRRLARRARHERPRSLVSESLRRDVAARLDIRVALLSASHTHAAPAFLPFGSARSGAQARAHLAELEGKLSPGRCLPGSPAESPGAAWCQGRGSRCTPQGAPPACGPRRKASCS